MTTSALPARRAARRLQAFLGRRRLYTVVPFVGVDGEVEIQPDRISTSPATWQAIKDDPQLYAQLRVLGEELEQAEGESMRTRVGDAGSYARAREAELARERAANPPGVLESADQKVRHLVAQLTRASSARNVPNFSRRLLESEAEVEALAEHVVELQALLQVAQHHLRQLTTPQVD